MPVPWDKIISAASSVVIAATAVIGTVMVLRQIKLANRQIRLSAAQARIAANNLYSTNQYKFEIDLASAMSAIVNVETSAAAQQGDAEQKKKVDLAVNMFDSIMQAGHALRNNDGISNVTWDSVLQRYCPKLSDANYTIAGNGLGATKDACEETRSWKTKAN